MAELEKLIFEFVDSWNLWDDNKDYYINKLLPQLMKHDTSLRGNSVGIWEKKKMDEIRAVASSEEWENLPSLFRKVATQKNHYSEKYKLEVCKGSIKSFGAVTVHAIKGNDHLRNQIVESLKRNDIETAKDIYSRSNGQITESEFRRLVRNHVREKLLELLGASKFVDADNKFVISQPFFQQEVYESLKADFIDEYLTSAVPESYDYREKALAIAQISKNVLLKARAGSGKTTTIACKTFFLIEKEKIKPEEILLLTFNREAKQELIRKIGTKFGMRDVKNIMTFHGLAYKIVKPKHDELLFDEGGCNFSIKELSSFVQNLLRKTLDGNSAFKKSLYLYFRKELQEIKRERLDLDDSEYLMYRRNYVEISLKGERVKSLGEKYIADFLCEHNIDYFYESVIYVEGRSYRPDFTINSTIPKKSVVIEFWGIDESDPNKEVPDHWTITWDDYYKEMQWKREYWKSKGACLIELSIQDLRNVAGDRLLFEGILKAKLEEAGIQCNKLPEHEIVKRVVESKSKIVKITDMFVQFIQKAKKNMMTASDVRSIMEQYCHDEKTNIFLDLGTALHEKYEKELINREKIDFDDLIEKAASIIDESEGELDLPSGDENVFSIRKLKWLIMDEYQDFSPLFYYLVQKIKKHNEQLKIFCVGDDWQAINGFAGSDIKYINDFKAYYPDHSGEAYLVTNYRSAVSIVELSNRLMRGMGRGGKPMVPNDVGEGEIKIIHVDSVRIDKNNHDDEKFLFRSDQGYMVARYLKKCHQIIVQNPGKSIAILHRTNNLYYKELDEFKNRLKHCLKSGGCFNREIDCSTIHRYKGKEKDIVIIMQVCNKSIPLLHPDNHLYEIFGQSLKKALEEERRLFYVALTRAREKLYILTEKGKESDYLVELGLTG